MQPTIVDIHTHRSDAQQALICIEPSNWDPQPGCYYAVGTHPWHADALDADTVSSLSLMALHPQVLAIGETGLDALYGPSLEVQQHALEQHIKVARITGRPLIVHNVRCTQQLLPLLRGMRVAIHGFRGKPTVMRTLLDAGFYLSIGPLFNIDSARQIPADRLLIETDDSNVDILTVAARVADARHMSTPDLLALVTANASRFLST